MDWELFKNRLSDELYGVESDARDFYSGVRTKELYERYVPTPKQSGCPSCGVCFDPRVHMGAKVHIMCIVPECGHDAWGETVEQARGKFYGLGGGPK